MQLTEINRGAITLTLDPDDALWLSKACALAAIGMDNTPPIDYFQSLHTDAATRELLYDTLAVAFESMGAAAVMHNHIAGPRADEVSLSGQRANGATWHGAAPGGGTEAGDDAPTGSLPTDRLRTVFTGATKGGKA